MHPKTQQKTAPTDDACDRAYERIAALAEEHGLIVQAYGGVMTIAVPAEQRKAGIRQRVLDAHGLNETVLGGSRWI